jgi:hypothetical protein
MSNATFVFWRRIESLPLLMCCRDALVAMIVTETFQDRAAILLRTFRNPGERTGLVVTDQRRIHGAGHGSTRSYLWCGPILFHGTFARFHELRWPRQARERHTLATGQSKIEPRPPRGVYEMVGCSEEASPNVIPFVVGAGRRQYLAGEHNDFAVLIDP